MITPINTNWFMDANWNSVIAPQLTTAQTNYNAASSALSAYQPTYTAALQALLAGSTNVATLQTLRANFDTAQQQYNTLVGNVKTAATALIAAQSAAQSSVDTQGDTALDAYVAQLSTEINQQLTLSGVVSNTLGQQLLDANSTRNNARSTFFIALSDFSAAEQVLTDGRTLLQSLQDQLALANADVQIAQLQLNALPSGDPGIPAAQAALLAAQNAQSTKQSQVNAQQSLVNTQTSTRDSKKAALDTALASYTTAIDALIDVLQEGVASGSTFIQDLATAKAEALALSSSSLSGSASNDTALKAAHFTEFPTDNPEVIAGIAAAQAGAILQSTTTFNAGLDSIGSVTADISFPSLPSTGSMSIRDLMRFISAIQLLIGRLANELQTADQHIDELRLKIWNYQSNLLATTTALLQEWGFTLEFADNAYNLEAAKNNSDKSKQIVNEINNLIAQAGNINAVINQINAQIDDQNSRGSDIVTGLNNSNFIATDVINQAGNTSPNIYNTGDVLNQDPDAPYPTPRTDSPIVPQPTTIPHLPPFVPPSTTIPSSFPVNFTSSNDPSAYNLPDNTTPNQTDIDQLNSIIDSLNLSLYPIKDRISGPPINYEFISSYYNRQYVPVRNLEMFMSIDNSSLISTLISNLVKAFIKSRDHEVLKTLVAIPEGFEQFVEVRTRKPATQTQSEQEAQSIGSGAGITGSDILGSQGKVQAALSSILESDAFLSSLQTLTEQGSLIGGLAALTELPKQITNYSQLGLVRNDQLEEQGSVLDTKATALNAAAAATVRSLIETTKNQPLLKQIALSQIAKLPPGSLNEDEIKELIASLVFLLQTLLLLVAALLQAAAGGEASIDKIITKVFEKPSDEKIKVLIDDLKRLNVKLSENIAPSAPGFEEQLINELLPQLPPASQQALTDKIVNIFQDHGVSLTFTPKVATTEPFKPTEAIVEPFKPAPTITEPFKPTPTEAFKPAPTITEPFKPPITEPFKPTPTITEPFKPTPTEAFKPAPTITEPFKPPLAITEPFKPVPTETGGATSPIPLGTAVQNTLNTLPLDVRASVREDLTSQLTIQLDSLKHDILVDLERRPSIKERIQELTRSNTAPQTTSTTEEPTTAPPTPITLSPDLQNAIITALNEKAPEIKGFTPEDRNALVIALITGTITSKQAGDLISQFLREEALIERPTIANLIDVTGVPKTSGIPGESKSPAVKPKDTLALFREAFEQLSRQSDDNRLTFEVALNLADKVRDQSSFYQRSLDLLLDPAKSMIKNFSIFTRGSDIRDQQGPLSIPISG